MIRKFFSPPQFENEEDNFQAKFINGFAWTVIVLVTPIIIVYAINPAQDLTVPILSGLVTVMAIALYLLRRGNIRVSGAIIVILGWLTLGAQAYTADGVKDVVVMGFIAIGLLASIVMSWAAGGIVILFSIGAIWVLALLEANGYFTPRFQDPITYARDLSLVFLVITALIYFSTTSLREAIRRANKSEKELLATNQSLQELNLNLENRIASRTAELELANQRNERRARQFEAIAQVTRATLSIQDENELLPRLAQVISEQFGFYHTGIFLLDESRENAVLRASNSEGGKRMLARGHALKVGQTGIVGYVTATGAPRVALDVGADAVFFNNPDLPNTHSEAALPLVVAGEVIGALDVQSTEANAFTKEDVEVLSILADQVSVAIQNARSFTQTQKLLEEAKRSVGEAIQESWRVLQTEEKYIGYRVSGSTLKPIDRPLETPQVSEAFTKGEIVTTSGKDASLAIPIRLRGEVIGVMDLKMPGKHTWDPDEVDIARAVAERLSLAIETATLLQSTRRRAEIERLTSDISALIGSSSQFEIILKTAAQELSKALGASDVLVQIEPAMLEITEPQ